MAARFYPGRRGRTGISLPFRKWSMQPQKMSGWAKGTMGFEMPEGMAPYDSPYPTMWTQGPKDMDPRKAAYLSRVLNISRLGELKGAYGDWMNTYKGLDEGELAANTQQWKDWRSAELAKAHASGLVSNQTLNRQALGVQQEQLAAQQIRDRQKIRLGSVYQPYVRMLENVKTPSFDQSYLANQAYRQGMGGVYPGANRNA
jgi:hypothetical protein